MTETVYTLKNKKLFKAKVDENKSTITIESNVEKLDLFDGPTANIDAVKNGWMFQLSYKSILDLFKASHNKVLIGEMNDIYVDFLPSEPYPFFSAHTHIIKNFNASLLNNVEHNAEIHKNIYNYQGPRRQQFVTISSGYGNDRLSKYVAFSESLKNDKNVRFDNYIYHFDAGGGNDQINIDAYGINFLFGGKGDDHYDVNVQAAYPHLSSVVNQITDDILEGKVKASPIQMSVKIVNVIKGFYNYKSPYKTVYPSMTFISDYKNHFNHDDNNVDINISLHKFKGIVIIPRVYIASSAQLSQKVAKKLSPDPFYIIKVSHNYIMLHPNSIDNINFKFQYVSVKKLGFTVESNTTESFFQKVDNKHYQFNKLPKNFNYRKLRAQLNGVIYKRMSSFERKGSQYILSGNIK